MENFQGGLAAALFLKKIIGYLFMLPNIFSWPTILRPSQNLMISLQMVELTEIPVFCIYEICGPLLPLNFYVENGNIYYSTCYIAYLPGPFSDIGIFTIDDERSSTHPTAESEHWKPIGSNQEHQQDSGSHDDDDCFSISRNPRWLHWHTAPVFILRLRKYW